MNTPEIIGRIDAALREYRDECAATAERAFGPDPRERRQTDDARPMQSTSSGQPAPDTPPSASGAGTINDWTRWRRKARLARAWRTAGSL